MPACSLLTSAEAPAAALLGPRQVGKTTLALQLAEEQPSIYLDLDSEADLARLREPELYLEPHADKAVILDEIQRAVFTWRATTSSLHGASSCIRGLSNIP